MYSVGARIGGIIGNSTSRMSKLWLGLFRHRNCIGMNGLFWNVTCTIDGSIDTFHTHLHTSSKLSLPSFYPRYCTRVFPVPKDETQQYGLTIAHDAGKHYTVE